MHVARINFPPASSSDEVLQAKSLGRRWSKKLEKRPGSHGFMIPGLEARSGILVDVRNWYLVPGTWARQSMLSEANIPVMFGTGYYTACFFAEPVLL